jgi:hypothetical protein
MTLAPVAKILLTPDLDVNLFAYVSRSETDRRITAAAVCVGSEVSDLAFS